MTRIVAILLGFVASLGAAPASAGPRHQFFGVALAGTPDTTDVRQMAHDGVATARLLVEWPAVQPDEGSPPNWSAIDQTVGGLASQGIKPIPFVWGSPAWVAGRRAKPPLDSAHDRGAWSSFITQLVQRYGPGGEYWTDPMLYDLQFPGHAAVPIRSWQVWNEPNGKVFFAPRPSARRYAKLLRISDAAIRAVDPGAKILLSGLVGYGKVRAWTFLNRLYRIDGFKRLFDATALHPYAHTTAQLADEVHLFRKVMKRHGDARTPLWITELGWGSAPPNSGGQLNVGIQGQKRRLKGAFRLLLSHRRSWHVPRLYWFEWRDPARGTPGLCPWCPTAGLRKHNRDPKPSLRAFRRLAHAG